MRREIIELMLMFRADVLDLETKVVFISESDFIRMKEFLREFQEMLSKHSQKASELESKIDAMLKI
ncbi:MAG: hypothetical protein JHC30_06235 [Caldisericum sp.]|jgi:hypothetical protein|nr:hypothetical protein [Caldisericum sp.]